MPTPSASHRWAPQSKVSHSRSRRSSLVSRPSTRTAAGTTSVPIPSPGTTAIRTTSGPHFLDRAEPAGDRTRRDDVGRGQVDLARTGAAREVAVLGADGDLVGPLRHARARV